MSISRLFFLMSGIKPIYLVAEPLFGREFQVVCQSAGGADRMIVQRALQLGNVVTVVADDTTYL